MNWILKCVPPPFALWRWPDIALVLSDGLKGNEDSPPVCAGYVHIWIKDQRCMYVVCITYFTLFAAMLLPVDIKAWFEHCYKCHCMCSYMYLMKKLLFRQTNILTFWEVKLRGWFTTSQSCANFCFANSNWKSHNYH